MNYKLNTHLLDNFFDAFGTSKHADVKDCGDVYTAELELAGFAKEDIDITATNDNLIIKAKNDKRQRDFKLNYMARFRSQISHATLKMDY